GNHHTPHSFPTRRSSDLDSKIATVDGNGNVKGVSEGTVNIIIVSSISGEVKMKEIKVTRPEVESIDINKVSTGKVYLLDEVKLQDRKSTRLNSSHVKISY